MDTLARIKEQKFIAIIRGYNPEESLLIAEALFAGGVHVLEIAMNSPKPLQTIEKITDELGDHVTVGAGTVLDPESARAAILAGREVYSFSDFKYRDDQSRESLWCRKYSGNVYAN